MSTHRFTLYVVGGVYVVCGSRTVDITSTDHTMAGSDLWMGPPPTLKSAGEHTPGLSPAIPLGVREAVSLRTDPTEVAPMDDL